MKNCEIEVIRVPSLKSAIKRIIFEQTLFYRYIKKCDIFFTPTLSLPLFAPGKKIVTIHDMVPFVVDGKYSQFRLLYIKTTTKMYVKRADIVLTVSDNSRNDICRILSVPPQKVKTIYNFIPEGEDILLRDGGDIANISVEKPYLLTVSTLQPAKNISRLIEAFSLFHNKHPQYHLYIVGNKGWGYAPLFELTMQLQLQNNVHFTGYLEERELSSMYEHCAGVVYVSLYEGFGIPPLEGFYHDKVCVASNISSIPEVVGDAGVLVDPINITEIANGLELMSEQKNTLRLHIPEQIAKFAPAKQASKFLDLIDSI